jgi:hypothetical protein
MYCPCPPPHIVSIAVSALGVLQHYILPKIDEVNISPYSSLWVSLHNGDGHDVTDISGSLCGVRSWTSMPTPYLVLNVLLLEFRFCPHLATCSR